jgi:hypothetical protein
MICYEIFLTDVAYASENSRSKKSCSKSHCANMCFMLNAYITGCTRTQLVHSVDAW